MVTIPEIEQRRILRVRGGSSNTGKALKAMKAYSPRTRR